MLAQAIVREGVKAVAAGLNPMDLKRGIDMAVEAVVEDVKKRSKKVSTNDEIAQVGTISANGEREIGEMIAKAMQKVGNEGVITVEEAKSLETELDVVEGMQFDRGYLSPYFVTNAEKMVCELENPYILLHEKKLSGLQAMLPVLEAVVQSRQAAADRRRGRRGRGAGHARRQQAARRPQGRGGEGAGLRRSPQGDARGHRHPDRRPAHQRGSRHQARERHARHAGQGQEGAHREGKHHHHRRRRQEGGHRGPHRPDPAQIEETTSDYDREKLQERLAKLAGGVAVIRVGGATEVEVKERKDRVDDAMHATRAAVEEGIVAGGGVALLYATKALAKLKPDNDDQKVGIDIVRRALQAPARLIAENAGIDGSIVIGKLLESNNANYGFDAQTGNYVDMVKAGIIDPTKVVRCALQDAASVAGLLVTTEAMVAEKPEKKPRCPPVPAAAWAAWTGWTSKSRVEVTTEEGRGSPRPFFWFWPKADIPQFARGVRSD